MFEPINVWKCVNFLLTYNITLECSGGRSRLSGLCVSTYCEFTDRSCIPIHDLAFKYLAHSGSMEAYLVNIMPE